METEAIKVICLFAVLFSILAFSGCGYSYERRMTIAPASQLRLPEEDIAQITADVSSVAQARGYTSDEKAVADYNKACDKDIMLCIYKHERANRFSGREQVSIMVSHNHSESMAQIRVIVCNISQAERVEADILDGIDEKLSTCPSLSCGSWHTPQAPGPLEQAYIRQGECIGPLYLPAHFIGGCISLIGTGTWHEANFMAAGPYSNPPRRFK